MAARGAARGAGGTTVVTRGGRFPELVAVAGVVGAGDGGVEEGAGPEGRGAGPVLCRDSAVADALIGDVSEGKVRGTGFGVTGTAGAVTEDGVVAAGSAEDDSINSLIRSTVEGSRLARALALTSSPHFWIRSSNS